MKAIFFILLLISIGAGVSGQSGKDEKKRESAFYTATKHWFAAWKLVSRDIFKIDKVRPVDFVFFDDKYVYSTSTITIKNGKPVKGCNLLNLSLKWKKQLHHDTITLPDKAFVPLRLMSFAAEIPNTKGKSFFAMPLPAYWEQSGTSSKELGLEKLITGVFIHEFSHSQQMQNFGRQITQFEKQHNFGIEFSDDIVQNLFEKDSGYVEIYHEELNYFYQSLQGDTLNIFSAKKGLTFLNLHQEKYFKGNYSSLKEIDHFFLTMEGLGQYAMYLWLTDPGGGNIKKELAIEGVRRKKKWWSQDEGFALFLILDKLVPPATWAQNMFGNKTENVADLIARFLP